MSDPPDLRFLLSINSENAWSNLLATLMTADPGTTAAVLGIDGTIPFVVRREVSKSRGRKASDRPDLIVESSGRTIAVLEVKLLDRASQKSIIHKNAAARQKSRLAKLVATKK